MQVLWDTRGLGSDLVPCGCCTSLGQSKPRGQPRFKGQGRETPEKLLVGNVQNHVAKGVGTLQGGELGPFRNPSAVLQWAGELPRTMQMSVGLWVMETTPSFSYFI